MRWISISSRKPLACSPLPMMGPAGLSASVPPTTHKRVARPALPVWRGWLVAAAWLWSYAAVHAGVLSYSDGGGVMYLNHASQQPMPSTYDSSATLIAGGVAPAYQPVAGLSGLLNMPVAAPSMARSRALVQSEEATWFQPMKPILQNAAMRHGVDYHLLKALIAAESAFNPGAVSPKGAVGLMQLMPATASRFGVTGDALGSISQKLVDPAVNIPAGTRYLRRLMDMFPGRTDLALAAYNAGEGAVQKYGNQIPPYPETQNYVRTVMGFYRQIAAPSIMVGGATEPSSGFAAQPVAGAGGASPVAAPALALAQALPNQPAQQPVAKSLPAPPARAPGWSGTLINGVPVVERTTSDLGAYPENVPTSPAALRQWSDASAAPVPTTTTAPANSLNTLATSASKLASGVVAFVGRVVSEQRLDGILGHSGAPASTDIPATLASAAPAPAASDTSRQASSVVPFGPSNTVISTAPLMVPQRSAQALPGSKTVISTTPLIVPQRPVYGLSGSNHARAVLAQSAPPAALSPPPVAALPAAPVATAAAGLARPAAAPSASRTAAAPAKLPHIHQQEIAGGVQVLMGMSGR